MRTKTATIVMLFGFLFTSWLSAQESAPTDRPQLTTSYLKRSVGFLRVVYREGTVRKEARGTCFFVFFEDKRLGENLGFGYLVTNRHMAVPRPGIQGAPVVVERTFVRLNLKRPNQGAESVEIPLEPVADAGWHFPRDESVDLAVMPFRADLDTFDIELIHNKWFATRDVIQSEGVVEGDNVLLAGFFYQFAGLRRIQPIVRQGILAMMPDEKLQTTMEKEGDLYLADVHVFGGNSGAPVFLNLGGLRGNKIFFRGNPFRLLGIVSGYFYEDQEFKLRATTTLTGRSLANSGVATVVPVDELKTLLELPDLQRLRDREVAKETPKD